MRITFIYFLLVVTFGCNRTNNDNIVVVKDYKIDSDTTVIDYSDDPWKDRSRWADLSKTDSIRKAREAIADSLFEINTSFLNSVLMIQPIEYHQSEIPLSYANVDWSGILNTDSGTYFTLVDMKIEIVNDGLYDKKVVIDSTYKCDYLFYGLDTLQGKIDVIDSIKIHLLPGDTLHLGKEIYLYATGNRNERNPESIYGITEYKIYVGDTSKNYQLYYSKGFDDTFIEILWMGDLNHDGVYDLIIDTSTHYNRSSPTLYLSLTPDDYRIMEEVSSMISVGC